MTLQVFASESGLVTIAADEQDIRNINAAGTSLEDALKSLFAVIATLTEIAGPFSCLKDVKLFDTQRLQPGELPPTDDTGWRFPHRDVGIRHELNGWMKLKLRNEEIEIGPTTRMDLARMITDAAC